MPALAVLNGSFDHPARKMADRAGSLDHVDKLRGRQQTELRVFPAHESLRAGHRMRRAADLRLKVEAELIVAHRCREIANDLDLSAMPVFVSRHEDGEQFSARYGA